MEKKCWNTFVNHCTVFLVDLLLDFMLFFMVNSCLERRVSLQKHSNVFFKTLYLFLKWEQVGSKIFLYSVEIKFKDRGIKDDENRFQYFFNNKSNVILTNDMIISGLSFVIRIKYRIFFDNNECNVIISKWYIYTFIIRMDLKASTQIARFP